MSKKTEGKYCVGCEKVTPHEVKKVNHALHFVLSFLTGGFWLIIWLLLILGGQNSTCLKCGLNQ